MFKLIFYFSLLVGLCTGAEDPPEKALLEHLFENYDRDARPIGDLANHELSVNVSLYLMQLVDLNVRDQVLVSYVWVTLEWTDHLLKWDPSHFSNLTDIRLPIERIWIPDLELYNSATGEFSLSDGHTPAILKSNGQVSWIEPKQLHSICPADVTYFPFDQQICRLKIGSWTHDGLKMNLILDKEKVEKGEYASLGEWNLVSGEMHRTANYYSCCPEPYLDTTATLVMSRKPMHYIWSTIFPCILLSVLTLVTFQLSPFNVLRVALEITVLLVLFVYMWSLSGMLPDSPPTTPILYVYLIFLIILSFTSILITIFLLKLYNVASSSSNSRPLPPSLKFLLRRPKSVPWTPHRNDSIATTRIEINDVRDDIPLTEYSYSETLPNSTSEPPQTTSIIPPPSSKTIYKTCSVRNVHSDSEPQLGQEWRIAAKKLDTLCHWIFLTTTIILNLLLLILPLSRI